MYKNKFDFFFCSTVKRGIIMKTARNFLLKKIIKISLIVILSISFVGSAVTSYPFLEILPLDEMLIDDSRLLLKNECTAESFTNSQYTDVSVINTVINDMSFFDDLTIETIRFENCDFRGCTINLPSSVTYVAFTNCNIDDFLGLADNLNINELFMNSCNVKSIEGLRYLKNLEYLTINHVGIESVEELANLNNLKELSLFYTCIKSIEPLRDSSIESLDIGNSLNIKDLSPLMSMKSLKTLYAINCQMGLTEDILNHLKKNKVETEFTKDDLKYKQQLKQIANDIFADDMTDEEKIESAVKYITDNMEYDDRTSSDTELLSFYNVNALPEFLNGVGICRNYSAITTVLLQEAGIEVYEVLNDGHIGNLIHLNDKYYWLDVTQLDVDAPKDVTKSELYMNDNFATFSSLVGPLSLPQSYCAQMYVSTDGELSGIVPDIDIDPDYPYSDLGMYTYSYIEDSMSSMHIPFGVLVVVSFIAIIVFKVKSKKKSVTEEVVTEQHVESITNI